MTTFDTRIVVLDVFKVAAQNCMGPHQKAESDWPPRCATSALVGYFTIPLNDSPEGLKIRFEIPLCDRCLSRAVD
jgi:hypothetical protein